MAKYTVSGFEATPEQELAIDTAKQAFTEKKSMKIRAGAGASKTSILVALSHHLPGRGQFLSFNHDIAKQAKAVFNHSKVKANTVNGLAFKQVGHKYADRLKRLMPDQVVQHFNVQDYNGTVMRADTTLARMAMTTVKNFNNSLSETISYEHLPDYLTLADTQDSNLETEVLLLSRKVWKEMDNESSTFPVTHDFYMKKWSLMGAPIDADYILFDEAQDTSDLVIAMIQHQHLPVFWVGDDNQSIYEWNNAVDAMSKVETAYTVNLTQSFRFGPEVANVANKVLHEELGSDFVIRGFDAIPSVVDKIDKPDVIICRTNAVAMREAIGLLARNIPAKFNGDLKEIISTIQAIDDLKTKSFTRHPDFKGFKSYRDFVQYCETEEGMEFRSVIKMYDDHGSDKLVSFLKKMHEVNDPNAVIVTTAHKSKGLEYDKVVLTEDFIDTSSKRYTPEESRLLYVAVTRAKKALDISRVPILMKLVYNIDIRADEKKKEAERKSMFGRSIKSKDRFGHSLNF